MQLNSNHIPAGSALFSAERTLKPGHGLAVCALEHIVPIRNENKADCQFRVKVFDSLSF